MFFRMIYDDKLAQAAYLIGCQKTGEAIIIDPERDIDRYVRLAEKEGLRITAVAETHIHADYLSGVREVAERLDAMVYLSDEGGDDWKYQWLTKRTSGSGTDAGAYNHRLLHDGDMFKVGNIEFRVIHTPGHTPEHICFVVTDRGGGAAEPMGIVTGDFVFVGDLGRPDLLETAVGVAGTKEQSARALLKSTQRLESLADFMQVWPAHGAGSACGKALGAVPQSTIGYEKRFNPGLTAAKDEAGFLKFILDGQPEPPSYFARMKRENRSGPAVLGGLPRPKPMSVDETRSVDARQAVVIDTRAWNAFRSGHIPGSLSILPDASFPTLAASYIDPGTPIYLVIEEGKLEDAVRDLVRVGQDAVAGYITPSILAEAFARGLKKGVVAEIDAAGAKAQMNSDGVMYLDVRRADEFKAGHIPGSRNIVHTRLAEGLEGLPRNKKVIVNCRSGVRSARACALLQRAGFDVVNLTGGFMAWEQSGAEVEK